MVPMLQQLQSKLERVARAQPSRITGRHVYFCDLQQLAKVQRDTGNTGVRMDAGKRVTRNHAKLFSQMSADRRARFDSRAHELREDRFKEQRDTIVELKSAFELVRLRSEEAAAKAPPLSVVILSFGFQGG